MPRGERSFSSQLGELGDLGGEKSLRCCEHHEGSIYDECMPGFSFIAIDHVQLAMPPGEESTARRFYADILELRELPKPPQLAARGGCWFGGGGVQLHMGVEQDFRPAKKAHPAIRCAGYEDLLAKLKSAGVELTEVDDIPGVRRCHIFDPFGNRIELIAA